MKIVKKIRRNNQILNEFVVGVNEETKVELQDKGFVRFSINYKNGKIREEIFVKINEEDFKNKNFSSVILCERRFFTSTGKIVCETFYGDDNGSENRVYIDYCLKTGFISKIEIDGYFERHDHFNKYVLIVSDNFIPPEVENLIKEKIEDSVSENRQNYKKSS